MRSSRLLPAFSVALLASLALPASALGQEPASPRIDALKACRAIANDAERLACFDRASSEIVAAAERGEIRILTKKDVEETKRGLFGFKLPKLGLFGGGDGNDEDEPEPLDMLESVVTSARQLDPKTYVFTIAEGGATWQIKEAPSRFVGPRRGDKVVLKRAALGSYFIRVNGQVGVKGRRID